MSLQAFGLTVLAYTGQIQIWHIVVLAFLYGSAVAVEVTARQAMLIELAGREALPSATTICAKESELESAWVGGSNSSSSNRWLRCMGCLNKQYCRRSAVRNPADPWLYGEVLQTHGGTGRCCR